VALFLVWSLSPIGGQGALRATTLSTNVRTRDLTLSSYPFSNLSAYTHNIFESGDSGSLTMINRYVAPAQAAFATQDLGLHHANQSSNGFTAAVKQAGGLEEAVRITQRDLWRNVRIPFLHSLPGYNEKENEWISVQNDIIPDYSSLIGVPIRGLLALKSGNASFIIGTNYQTVMVSPVLNTARNLLTVHSAICLG
jgi:hypothetical protein